MPPLLGRGVLLDVAGFKGLDRLPPLYGISGEELESCAAGQGTQVQKGDVLLVRTGYATLWDQEGPYLDAAGIAKSGSVWAMNQGVRAIGADK